MIEPTAEVSSMKRMIVSLSTFAIAISAIVLVASRADAQLRGMMVPLSTTMVITKPPPGSIFGNQQVDDPRGVIHWPDIWQAVRQYRPNFNVTGLGEDTFAKMEPGETMTVRGMFSPNNQTFEVMSADPGGGNFAPAQHY
jgi:hypothetical protein